MAVSFYQRVSRSNLYKNKRFSKIIDFQIYYLNFEEANQQQALHDQENISTINVNQPYVGHVFFMASDSTTGGFFIKC